MNAIENRAATSGEINETDTATSSGAATGMGSRPKSVAAAPDPLANISPPGPARPGGDQTAPPTEKTGKVTRSRKPRSTPTKEAAAKRKTTTPAKSKATTVRKAKSPVKLPTVAKPKAVPEPLPPAPLTSIGEVGGDVDICEPDPSVKEALATGKQGRPINNLGNVMRILSQDPRWAGRIIRNEFTEDVLVDGERLDDTHAATLQMDIGLRYEFDPGLDKVKTVARMVARKKAVNPLADYLKGLKWDGERRLDTWQMTALNVEDTPIHRAFARRWCISAVARVLTPGCKAECILLFTGPQGVGKSTALRLLAGDEWFADTEFKLGEKDAMMLVHAAWIYEVAELASFTSAKAERIKSFVSSTVDTFRPPNARSVDRYPRHTVFAATTNDPTPLKDPTGSRRYWPIDTPGPLDRAWLISNRDQIWAEAVAAFHAGDQWYLTPEEEAQREALSDGFEYQDPWKPKVEAWAQQQEKFTTHQVLLRALGIEAKQQGKAQENRAGAVLRSLGYEKRKAGRREMPDGSRPWLWELPERL